MSAAARRYFVRAREQLRGGDREGACQDFRAALELAPQFVEARLGYALTLATTDPARAAQSLQVGITRAERPFARARLLCALGDVRLAAGEHAAADAAFREAAQHDPSVVGDRRALLCARTGRFDEAFAALLVSARRPR